MDLTLRFLMNGNSIWVAVLHWQTKPCCKTKKEDCAGQDSDEVYSSGGGKISPPPSMGVKEPCPRLGEKTALHRKLGEGGSKEMMAPSMGHLLIREAYKQTQTLHPYHREVVIQGVLLFHVYLEGTFDT